MAGIAIELFLQLAEPVLKLFSVGLEGLGIQGEPFTLHSSQHPGQREFDLLQQPLLALLMDLPLQMVTEASK